MLNQELYQRSKILHYPMVKKDQCRGLSVALIKFRSGLRTYHSTCTQYIFFYFVKCSLDLLLIDLYS